MSVISIGLNTISKMVVMGQRFVYAMTYPVTLTSVFMSMF